MGAERLCCPGASPRTRLCCCGCGSQLQHLRDECVMAAAGSAGGLGARTISLQGSLLGSFLIKIWCQCLPISCCSQWQFAFAVSQHAQVSNGVGKEVLSKERTWCPWCFLPSHLAVSENHLSKEFWWLSDVPAGDGEVGLGAVPVGVAQAQPCPLGLLLLGSGLWVQRCTVHLFFLLLSDAFHFQLCLGFTGLLEDDQSELRFIS